jgi:hypothetical protein
MLSKEDLINEIMDRVDTASESAMVLEEQGKPELSDFYRGKAEAFYEVAVLLLAHLRESDFPLKLSKGFSIIGEPDGD